MRRLQRQWAAAFTILLVASPVVKARAQGGVGTRGGATATRQDDRPPGRTFRFVARADGFLAEVDAIHLGVGTTTDVGSYVRLDAVIAGGARNGGGYAASGRAEVIGRFLLDPFRQARWGVYAGGGLIARHEEGRGTNGYLTLLVGAELPGSRELLPAVELGIGGGTRIGLAVRRGRPNRR